MKIADFDITKGVGDEPTGHVLRLHEKKKKEKRHHSMLVV